MMKYYKKIAVLLILVLTLFTGLIACGNSAESVDTAEEVVEETAVEETEENTGAEQRQPWFSSVEASVSCRHGRPLRVFPLLLQAV